jgi:hypothetical protein
VVRDAVTDAELTPRMAPIGGGNDFADRELDLTSLMGQTVYIEVVDNADGSGYAWMCVDQFRLENSALGTPGGINGNGNFETGDYTNWTPSGEAFGTLPVQSNGNTQGKEQYFFTETLAQGETATGMLTSAPFSVTENTLAFLLAGWTDTPDGGGQKAWVSVRLAADDSEIARIQAPQATSPFQERSVLLYDYMGQDVYVEIVDNNDNSGYGWIAADDFRLVDNPDMDGDGLSNDDELALGTDPLNPDTDGDGLSDGDEVHVYGTDPLNTDSDNDGLTDGDEVNVYGTNPLHVDTDRDGIFDGVEVAMGSDPLNPDNRVPAAGAAALALGGLLLILLSLYAMRGKHTLSSTR